MNNLSMTEKAVSVNELQKFDSNVFYTFFFGKKAYHTIPLYGNYMIGIFDGDNKSFFKLLLNFPKKQIMYSNKLFFKLLENFIYLCV